MERSWATTDIGIGPHSAKEDTGMNVPSPLPRMTDTVLSPELVTRISGCPSALMSATVTDVGFLPTGMVSGGELALLSAVCLLTEQENDGVIRRIDDNQIGLLIAIEIAGRETGEFTGRSAGSGIKSGLERAIRISEVDGDFVSAGDDTGRVRVRVAVQSHLLYTCDRWGRSPRGS